MDYMNLLVEQLKNQNPLEPMNNEDMTAQLVQFTEVEQLESMNTSFAEVLTATKDSYASSLIGKEVSFRGALADGSTELVSGSVEQVVKTDNVNYLVVGEYAPTLEDVLTVGAKSE
jgi:flagellar basal-body rod modification protein FlgD